MDTTGLTRREGGQLLLWERQPYRALRWRGLGARWRDYRTDMTVAHELMLAPRQLVFGSY